MRISMTKMAVLSALLVFGLTAPADAAAAEAAADAVVDAASAANTPAALRPSRTTQRLEDLNEKSLEELEKLYAAGSIDGGMPTGRGIGRAFFLGLPRLTEIEDDLRRLGFPTFMAFENLVANLVWNGKTFQLAPSNEDGVLGTLTNQVLGLDIATAKVRLIEESDVADEAQTFYLDYSTSSLPLVRGVQDYVRKIDDGLYLGKAFLQIPGQNRRILACYFALDFKS